jgi:phosphoglycolate phosphatase
LTARTSTLEIVRPDVTRGAIRHALFDFDGTLSLIREGWQQVMAPLMVAVLAETPAAEPPERLQEVVRDYIDRTTGVQTIYQMIGLADMVRERGGEPLEPAEYKQRYLDGLWERIKDRVAGLREGRIPRRDLMVPGAEEVLAGLAARGVRCYLASGTDVEFVRDECAALGLAGYFWQIHGAIADYRSYSKAQVIRQILSEYDVQGHQLVTFGDGFVEIEETVGAGGIAVGVASDEAGRSGAVDAWKRRRLIEAGAHVIVPDFQDANALLAYLFAED